jgi:hypothetical protein
VNLYRTKADPLNTVSLPSELAVNGMSYSIPRGGSLDTETLLAAGYYLDITPEYDSATHQPGVVPIWNEQTGTVQMNVVESPQIPPTVPQEVTMRQARLYLLGAGLLPTVNAAISTMNEAAKIEWEYSNAVRRQEPLVAGMKSILGLTDAQLDQMFIDASLI